MWHDNETTIDYLNFGVVADACASLLRRAGGAPISIGVSGGWGAGKSSLVQMIASRLKAADKPAAGAVGSDRGAVTGNEAKQNTYVVVTFNPWLYQDFESARSALLQIVGDEVLRLAEKDPSLLKKAKRLWQRINLLRLAQLGGEAAVTITTGIPVGPIGKAIGKVVGLMGSSDEEAESGDEKEEGVELSGLGGLIKPGQPLSLPNEIHAFRVALEKLLDELKVTLVVFVDDLDRCLPKTAISTLESIRLLLFIKRTAFVIAADNEFIRGAVKVHFEGTGITSDIATNYFDKLIQVPLHVPRLGVNEAKAYLVLLLLQRATEDGQYSAEKFEAAKESISSRLRQSWKGETITAEFLYGLVGPDQELVKLMDLAQGLASLMFQATSVSANPRLMKRFLNTVFLRSALAEPQGIELDIPSLAKWHLLERYDENLANALAAMVNSENDGQVEILRLAEAAADEGTPLPAPFPEEAFAREWLKLSPVLGTTDLRALLHLSRDTATRDFGDDNMTPESRGLRDTLKLAASGHAELSALILKVGQAQAEIAMTKAWQGNASSRTWKAAKDVFMLIEVCKTFPELGKKAASLLNQAPLKDIGPGIIPSLTRQPWASETLKTWQDVNEVQKATKNAINAQLKKGI